MPIFNCGINFISTWPANFALSNAAANQGTTFAITDTRLYVPVLTLTTDDNGKLFQQLKSGFKRTINWNKYQTKTKTQSYPRRYLDYLIDPSFQAVNKLFVLMFDVNANRLGHSRYYLPTAKVEDCNVMIKKRFLSTN